jgi:hypothetical protein
MNAVAGDTRNPQPLKRQFVWHQTCSGENDKDLRIMSRDEGKAKKHSEAEAELDLLLAELLLVPINGVPEDEEEDALDAFADVLTKVGVARAGE